MSLRLFSASVRGRERRGRVASLYTEPRAAAKGSTTCKTVHDDDFPEKRRRNETSGPDAVSTKARIRKQLEKVHGKRPRRFVEFTDQNNLEISSSRGIFSKPALGRQRSPSAGVRRSVTARGPARPGNAAARLRLRLSRALRERLRSRAPASRAFAPRALREEASARSRKSAKRTRRLASAVGMTASSSLAGAAPAASAAWRARDSALARGSKPRARCGAPPSARRFRFAPGSGTPTPRTSAAPPTTPRAALRTSGRARRAAAAMTRRRMRAPPRPRRAASRRGGGEVPRRRGERAPLGGARRSVRAPRGGADAAGGVPQRAGAVPGRRRLSGRARKRCRARAGHRRGGAGGAPRRPGAARARGGASPRAAKRRAPAARAPPPPRSAPRSWSAASSSRTASCALRRTWRRTSRRCGGSAGRRGVVRARDAAAREGRAPLPDAAAEEARAPRGARWRRWSAASPTRAASSLSASASATTRGAWVQERDAALRGIDAALAERERTRARRCAPSRRGASLASTAREARRGEAAVRDREQALAQHLKERDDAAHGGGARPAARERAPRARRGATRRRGGRARLAEERERPCDHARDMVANAARGSPNASASATRRATWSRTASRRWRST